MSDQDPFVNKETQKPGEGEPSTPPADPFADKLAGITGDDGKPKYESVEAALEALKHSQDFIETLKEERVQDAKSMEAMKEEITKMKAIEEFQASLKPNQEPATTPAGEGEGKQKLDIDKLLEDKLNARSAEATANANLEKVISDLTTKFGDKTSEHITKVAKDLGTTPAELKDLAMKNPTMAMTLLGTNGPEKVSPNTSTTYPPRTVSEGNEAPKFERGVARGGFTDSELRDRWKEVGEYTRKRIGVE